MKSLLRLDDCDLGLVTLATLVTSQVDATPPPGWEPGPTPAMQLHVEIQHCERVTVGPYSRGPHFVLIERHGGFMAPASCEQGNFSESNVLSKIWIDDAEIAAYLHDSLGMPAAFAAIAVEESGVDGAAKKWVWTFGLPGETPSTIEEVQHDADLDSVIIETLRLFWLNDDEGISYLDATVTTGGDQWGNRFNTGNFRKPFLYATTGTETYAGTGDALKDSNLIGDFSHFRDSACTDPSW